MHSSLSFVGQPRRLSPHGLFFNLSANGIGCRKRFPVTFHGSRRLRLDRASLLHHFRLADPRNSYVSVCLHGRAGQPVRGFMFAHEHPTIVRPKRSSHFKAFCLRRCPEVAAWQVRHAEFHSTSVRNFARI
jgi:hypothetical protein